MVWSRRSVCWSELLGALWLWDPEFDSNAKCSTASATCKNRLSRSDLLNNKHTHFLLQHVLSSSAPQTPEEVSNRPETSARTTSQRLHTALFLCSLPFIFSFLLLFLSYSLRPSFLPLISKTSEHMEISFCVMVVCGTVRVESGASLAPGALFDRAISELSHRKTHTHTHTQLTGL